MPSALLGSDPPYSKIALQNQLRPEILNFTETQVLELGVQFFSLEETPKGLPKGGNTRGEPLPSRGRFGVVGGWIGRIAVVEHHLSTAREPSNETQRRKNGCRRQVRDDSEPRKESQLRRVKAHASKAV